MTTFDNIIITVVTLAVDVAVAISAAAGVAVVVVLLLIILIPLRLLLAAVVFILRQQTTLFDGGYAQEGLSGSRVFWDCGSVVLRRL